MAHAPPEETVVEVGGLVVANPKALGGAELFESVITPLGEPARQPVFDLYRPTVPRRCPRCWTTP